MAFLVDRRRLKFVILSSFVLAAFLTRLMPLSMSPYPYNNDSLTECEFAKEIAETGRLESSSRFDSSRAHSEAIPAMNVVLAFVGSALGFDAFQIGQLFVSVLSVLTVMTFYLIGREFSGGYRGGLVSGIFAIMMGTFVFTTASVWKESLGIALLVLAVLCFSWRGRGHFRLLTFVILMVLPLVHHLVTFVALLSLAFPLAWSWLVALSVRDLKSRHFKDLLVVVVPALWSGGYYSTASLDRFRSFTSPIETALIISVFCAFSIAAFYVLSMKRHSKMTFALIPGSALLTIAVLDYFGYLFPYKSSSSEAVILLMIAFAFFVSLAWYGAEVMVESVPLYRSLFLGLLFPPAVIAGYAVFGGLTNAAHQIIYRSFDFADLFIFLGAGAAVSALHRRRSRYYPYVAIGVVVALVVSFPFSYASSGLIGVRHDTQEYEVDAVVWLADHRVIDQMSSDERISYIAQAMAGIPKDATYLAHIMDPVGLPPRWFSAVEDEWATHGVNDYPKGLTVVPIYNFEKTISASNVYYVGGPAENRITILSTSSIGYEAVF